ncbi:DUF6656 family protein [Oryzifoliimicrobium ureilyticus]|uniref:DUF6656 family protein n=1 Tax=Oryzifoliimicrobium ureilyticus TaxID=3113724 RepID=UPI00307668E6
MAKLRYFAMNEVNRQNVSAPKAVHSEFLRTGRIDRHKRHWNTEERRYLTYEEVAEKTGKRLEAAGVKTYENINSFHQAIRFPKFILPHVLDGSPHLGYCHVTAARSRFAQYDDVGWAFYIANFYAELGDHEEHFFKDIDLHYSRMYFAIAMKATQQQDEERPRMTIDRSIRGNGLLFRTHDPSTAIKNVLMLGARNEQMRAIIRQMRY